MIRNTIVIVVILMLLSFAKATPALVQLPLTNPTSNDNKFATTDMCQTYNGGPCSVSRPIDVIQDESVPGWWYMNEPYACTIIWNTNTLSA